MSVVSMGRLPRIRRLRRLRRFRRRRPVNIVTRVHPATGITRVHPATVADLTGDEALLGSWLSTWIKKRKAKGLSLKTKIGGVDVSLEKAPEGAPGAPAPGAGGPLAFVRQNPLIIAGVAGGGLLIVMLLLKKRKRKGGRK